MPLPDVNGTHLHIESVSAGNPVCQTWLHGHHEPGALQRGEILVSPLQPLLLLGWGCKRQVELTRGVACQAQGAQGVVRRLLCGQVTVQHQATYARSCSMAG